VVAAGVAGFPKLIPLLVDVVEVVVTVGVVAGLPKPKPLDDEAAEALLPKMPEPWADGVEAVVLVDELPKLKPDEFDFPNIFMLEPVADEVFEPKLPKVVLLVVPELLLPLFPNVKFDWLLLLLLLKLKLIFISDYR